MENVPIYVKIDQYQELLKTIAAIDAKLQGVERTIDRITALKAQEDNQLKNWSDNLADIKGRVARVKEAFGKR